MIFPYWKVNIYRGILPFKKDFVGHFRNKIKSLQEVEMQLDYDPKETLETIKTLFETSKKLFIKKNENYGAAYKNVANIVEIMTNGESIELNDKDSMRSYQNFTRMLEKMMRYASLRFGEEQDKVGEPLIETLVDIGNYAFMLAEIEIAHSKRGATYLPEDEGGKGI